MSILNEIRENDEKLEVLDYVENTQPYLASADFMIMPLFEGSGMKIKTCEALMYGKYIIGTPEAFTGYEITPDIAMTCNTKTEFITAINKYISLGLNRRYNKDSRNLYLEKYTDKITLLQFKKLFLI